MYKVNSVLNQAGQAKHAVSGETKTASMKCNSNQPPGSNLPAMVRNVMQMDTYG